MSEFNSADERMAGLAAIWSCHVAAHGPIARPLPAQLDFLIGAAFVASSLDDHDLLFEISQAAMLVLMGIDAMDAHVKGGVEPARPQRPPDPIPPSTSAFPPGSPLVDLERRLRPVVVGDAALVESPTTTVPRVCPFPIGSSAARLWQTAEDSRPSPQQKRAHDARRNSPE